MKEATTIKLSQETKKRLASLGGKEDTYETIVLRLLDYYQERKVNKE